MNFMLVVSGKMVLRSMGFSDPETFTNPKSGELLGLEVIEISLARVVDARAILLL